MRIILCDHNRNEIEKYAWVIEKNKNVIELFKKHILVNFSRKDKVKIIECDAFDYLENVMPHENYDYAFVDIWRDASDGLPVYERFKKSEKNINTEFDYWIENFLISRKRALRFEELYEKYESGAPDMKKSFAEFKAALLGD